MELTPHMEMLLQEARRRGVDGYELYEAMIEYFLDALSYCESCGIEMTGFNFVECDECQER